MLLIKEEILFEGMEKKYQLTENELSSKTKRKKMKNTIVVFGRTVV